MGKAEDRLGDIRSADNAAGSEKPNSPSRWGKPVQDPSQNQQQNSVSTLGSTLGTWICPRVSYMSCQVSTKWSNILSLPHSDCPWGSTCPKVGSGTCLWWLRSSREAFWNHGWSQMWTTVLPHALYYSLLFGIFLQEKIQEIQFCVKDI